MSTDRSGSGGSGPVDCELPNPRRRWLSLIWRASSAATQMPQGLSRAASRSVPSRRRRPPRQPARHRPPRRGRPRRGRRCEPCPRGGRRRYGRTRPGRLRGPPITAPAIPPSIIVLPSIMPYRCRRDPQTFQVPMSASGHDRRMELGVPGRWVTSRVDSDADMAGVSAIRLRQIDPASRRRNVRRLEISSSTLRWYWGFGSVRGRHSNAAGSKNG